MTLDEVFAIPLSALIIAAALVVRPTHATCPRGWFVEGVRPSGLSRCLRIPPDNPNDWPGRDRRDRNGAGDADQTPRIGIAIRVFCPPTSRPLARGMRTIYCKEHR